MKPALLYGISESDEQHLKTSVQIRGKDKSDQEILEMYNKIVGDVQENDSILKIWQQQVHKDKANQKKTDLNKPDTIKIKPNLSLKKEDPIIITTKRVDKSFQLASITPPSQQRLPTKNTTNYSQGYRQSKPFSLKKQGRTATVYVQDPSSIPPSPEIHTKTPTTQQFVKRLSQNITRQKVQKHQLSNKISRTVMQMKNEQKHLREQMKQINRQQVQLQESLKQYHLQYKHYCRDIEQKHNINLDCKQIKSQKQILTLEPYSKPSLNILSKKVQIIQEYKTYTDKIEHEIRKIDYIVQIKKNNIQKQENSIQNSRVYTLLQQPIEEDQQNQTITQRPVLEGATYKEIMKARRNKNFSKLQQLIGQIKQEQSNQPLNEISSIKREETRIFENQHGQMKVNQNLRDLLLN